MGGAESCLVCAPCDQSCRRTDERDTGVKMRPPPILEATAAGDLLAIKSIVSIDPNAVKSSRDTRGNTVLHIAAAQGNVEMFSYLVELDPELLNEANE
jgi:ankyrin repeat protein